MKMNKEMMSKAEMPKAGGASDMMSLEGMDFEGEAAAEGEDPDMEAKENSPLAGMSDDELLKELEARGYEVPKPENEMAGPDAAEFEGEEADEEDSSSTPPVPVNGAPAKPKAKSPFIG